MLLSRACRVIRRRLETTTMKTHHTVALSLLAGAALGATAIQGLRAQAKPIAYVVAEIDVTNQEGYVKEYLPPSSKALLDAGAKYLARGSKTIAIKGEAPKRIVLFSFENLEKAEAAYRSQAFLEAVKVGEKYARFRIFPVEGLPPQ